MAESPSQLDEYSLYLSGMSIPDVQKATGIAQSTLRFRFKRAGILRGRSEAVRLAGKQGKLGGGTRGKSRKFTDKWKANISKAKKGKGNGTSIKKSGYIVMTMGENKDRGQHIVFMEQMIGRPLAPGECVHHKDHDKSNNAPDNLVLLTLSEHSRLHAIENLPNRTRDNLGRFT